MKCTTCGGRMLGDGFSVPVHCEFTYPVDRPVDAGPLYCDYQEPVTSVWEPHASAKSSEKQ